MEMVNWWHLRTTYFSDVRLVEWSVDLVHHQEGGERFAVEAKDEGEGGQRFFATAETRDRLEYLAGHNTTEHHTTKVRLVGIFGNQKRLRCGVLHYLLIKVLQISGHLLQKGLEHFGALKFHFVKLDLHGEHRILCLFDIRDNFSEFSWDVVTPCIYNQNKETFDK